MYFHNEHMLNYYKAAYFLFFCTLCVQKNLRNLSDYT